MQISNVLIGNDLLKQPNLTRQQSPQHSYPSLADGEKKDIRIYHDESTFYVNADQTRFWSDGQCQVLYQKSLEVSIMVSDFTVEWYGYLRNDKEMARLTVSSSWLESH